MDYVGISVVTDGTRAGGLHVHTGMTREKGND
jgi:hypothetical protein